MKDKLKKRFKELYKGKRLLAVQLDGFSHSIVYDSGTKDSEVIFDGFSNCMPEGGWSGRAISFFKGIGNSAYQNNATEYIYCTPEQR